MPRSPEFNKLEDVQRIRLLHWNSGESSSTREILVQAGFQVEYDETFHSALMREWRQHPPAAFVIDLSRLPSHGKEIAVALRQSPKTQQIPVVFCGGLPDKVKQIREALPDAAYCTINTLVKTLKSARPLATPIRPTAMMDRYSQRTTAQKLGISEGAKVVAINPPRNLASVIGALPCDVESTDEHGIVTLCFAHSVDEFRSTISEVRARAATTKLWILGCKKSSPRHNGLTDVLVRNTCLNLGLVDYKACSLDNDWTGMLFAPKKS